MSIANKENVAVNQRTKMHGREPYKVEQIEKILNAPEFYAYLSSDNKTSHAKTINLDEDALEILKAYYEGKPIIVKEVV